MNSNRSAIIVPPPSPPTVPGTNDIRDIKGPLPIPNLWLWLWIALAVALLAGVGIFALLGWRKKRALPPPIPVIPPHVRAKNKLSNALTLLHDPRLFCTLVSDTLRIYLEERFDFHAPDRTTEEFLLELQGTTILNAEQKQRLGEFLERCDLVKFAKFEPTETELRALLEAALRLIDETQYQMPLTPPRDVPVPPVGRGPHEPVRGATSSGRSPLALPTVELPPTSKEKGTASVSKEERVTNVMAQGPKPSLTPVQLPKDDGQRAKGL